MNKNNWALVLLVQVVGVAGLIILFASFFYHL
jgi:hypothetical protein